MTWRLGFSSRRGSFWLLEDETGVGADIITGPGIFRCADPRGAFRHQFYSGRLLVFDEVVCRTRRLWDAP
jgi:hypothetical protein